jgi:putative transposase
VADARGREPAQIPKLRNGSYFPSRLTPRRRAERALLAVREQAYIEGVSTRKADDLVQALSLSGIDKSMVSRICQEPDAAVSAFRIRPLSGIYPYVWFDALYLKVRQNCRIVSMAVVIAIGVRESGERTILDLDIGGGEDSAFWTAFLRRLVQRGLRGVELAINDAHLGLQDAIRTVLTGATWQRCRVHTMRNILANVPQRDTSMVVAAIRTIFAQPIQAEAKRQLVEVVTTLRGRWDKAADVLEAAAEDVLASMDLPLTPALGDP